MQERERQERERDRQTETETQRERDRDRETERDLPGKEEKDRSVTTPMKLMNINSSKVKHFAFWQSAIQITGSTSGNDSIILDYDYHCIYFRALSLCQSDIVPLYHTHTPSP